MTIAIEPMITMGEPEVWLAEDGWTIATSDGSLAAHFEHTVAILPGGPRILTPRVGDRGRAGEPRRAGPVARRPEAAPVCYSTRPARMPSGARISL